MAAERNHGLDLLRGLCAFAVVAYHFGYWRHDFIVTSAGTFGVYIFFVLSAVTMMMVYGERFAGALKLPVVSEFYRNRVTRILPLLALVSIIAITEAPNIGGVARSFLTGSGVFMLGLPGTLALSVGSWSLAIELVFYAVVPVIALAMPATRTRTLLAVAVVLLVAQQLSLRLNPDDGPFVWSAYITPITFAPFFALGLIVHRIKTKSASLYLPAMLLTAGAVFSYSFILPLDIYDGGIGYVALMALSGVVVFFAFNAKVPNALKAFSEFMGEISYALYLTHWIAYEGVSAVIDEAGALFPVAFFVAAPALAWVVYVGFERPARDWLRGARRLPRTSLSG